MRECRVYSEIVPHDAPAAELAARDPVGIILSGGPASIYEPGAPAVDPGIFDLGVPVLGICYGMQAMAAALGGEVSNTGIGEFGKTPVTLGEGSLLFGDLPPEQTAWMSHRDSVVRRTRRLQRDGLVRHRPRWRGWRTATAASTASSSTPRWPTRRAAPTSWATSCSTPARRRPRGRRSSSSRSRSS